MILTPGYYFEPRLYKCAFCGKSYTLQHTSHTAVDPSSFIERMRRLGYDVKVEIPCRNCIEDIKEIYRLEIEQYKEHYNEAEGLMPFVFYFRLSPNRPYHEAVVPNTLLCSLLLCLLKNERDLQWYTACSEDWHFVDEHAWGLEYLTGIKFED